MKSMKNLVLLCGILCAMSAYADKVTVYNGAGKNVAVAIIQGVWKGGEFKAHPGTMKAGALQKGQVSIFELRNGERADIDRPARTLGKDTVLVVYDSAQSLREALTVPSGATFDRQSTYTIGQIGNKELFIGSARASDKTSRPLVTLTGPNVVLYKVYKGNVADKSDWSETKSLGEPVPVTGDKTESTLTRAKKKASSSAKRFIQAALTRIKGKTTSGKKDFDEQVKALEKGMGGRWKEFTVLKRDPENSQIILSENATGNQIYIDLSRFTVEEILAAKGLSREQSAELIGQAQAKGAQVEYGGLIEL